MTFSLPKLIADTSTTAIRSIIQAILVLLGILGTQIVGLAIVVSMTIGEGRAWVEVVLSLLSGFVLFAAMAACAYMCYITVMNKVTVAGYTAARDLIYGIADAAGDALKEKGIKNPKEYKSVASVINVAEYIHGRYQEFPLLVRYAIEFFLSRVPAGAVVTQVMNTDLAPGSVEDDGLDEEQQGAVDAVLEEYVFDHATFGWLLWFVPVAIGAQLVCIVLQRVF